MSESNATAILRPIALAIVWTLPSVWCAGHALAHELESGHHELQAAASADEYVTGVAEDHHHGHHHPDSSPAVAPDGSKKVDASTPLAVTVELNSSGTSLRCTRHVAFGYSARLALAVSGPRAPPIS